MKIDFRGISTVDELKCLLILSQMKREVSWWGKDKGPYVVVTNLPTPEELVFRLRHLREEDD